MRQYFVYIMASPSRTLYVGMTNNLERRVWEHKHDVGSSFVRKYGVKRLVHSETFARPGDAIAREKQIKGWLRAKKVALVEEGNPRWVDLSRDWE